MLGEPYTLNPGLWRLGSLSVLPPKDLAEAEDDIDGDYNSSYRRGHQAFAFEMGERKCGDDVSMKL